MGINKNLNTEASQAAEAKAPEKKRIYLLTYDHGGFILWGDQFEEKIDSAVDWLSKYPKFKIGLDNESFAYDEYARRAPSIIKKINKTLIDYKGRFAIGSCTYGQPLSVFINDESNVRQIVYAIRANLNHFGQTPKIYAISEHALHNQIPQLAKQAGYIGAIMRTHFMMYGYNPTYDSPYGMWIGEDGSAIPTVPTYEGEGAAFGVTTFDNWTLTRWPDRTTQSLEQFGELFAHIDPLLASRYDDIVHRHEGMLMYVEGFDEYRWVLLEDLPAIYGKPRDEYKPSSNDFRVRMPWGYCGNEIFNACSAAETGIVLAERANAAAFLLGAPSAQAALEESWKNLMVAQHHDVQICGLLSDARKYLPASRELSTAVAGESMRYIAGQFMTGGLHNLVVYNTHSFDIAERVEIEVAQRGAAGYRVTCGEEEVPCEAVVLDSNRGGPNRAVVSFEARVPAGTVRVFGMDTSKAADKVVVAPATAAMPATAAAPAAAASSANVASASGAVGVPDGAGGHAADFERQSADAALASGYAYDKASGILHTPLYEITLDRHGVKRLYDRENGVLIIDAAGGNLFKGVIDGIAETSDGAWSVAIGGGGAKATFAGLIGAIPILFEMKFYRRLRRIDCRVCFKHNGEKVGSVDVPGKVNGFAHEDKLRFVLSARFGGDCTSVRDLPFVIAETDEPMYIQGNYWAARKNADFGIAYFNAGCRGAVADGSEFSMPLVYANTYIWGTRMLYGDSVHEFAIYPFSPKSTSYLHIHKEALSYSFPPLTVATGKHGGRFAEADVKIVDVGSGNGNNCGGSCAGGGVIMTAMYPEGDAVLVRVCEYGGAAEAYNPPASQFGTAGERVTIMNEPYKPEPAAAPAGQTEQRSAGDFANPKYAVAEIVYPQPVIGNWEIITHRIYRAG